MCILLHRLFDILVLYILNVLLWLVVLVGVMLVRMRMALDWQYMLEVCIGRGFFLLFGLIDVLHVYWVISERGIFLGHKVVIMRMYALLQYGELLCILYGILAVLRLGV